MICIGFDGTISSRCTKTVDGIKGAKWSCSKELKRQNGKGTIRMQAVP